MRIAFLSVSDQLGGSEIALLEAMRRLRECRPDWQLTLVLPGAGRLHARATALGVRCAIVALPQALAEVGEFGTLRRGWDMRAAIALGGRLCAVAASWPSYTKQLRRTLAAICPDVVHTNGLKAHIAATRVAPAGSTLIWHLHEYVGRRPITAALLRRTVGGCWHIIANSESVARDVHATVNPSCRLTVIPNAVDLDRFHPSGPRLDLDALAQLPPATAGTVRVGLVGTFSRWKGHEVFLRALTHLSSRTPVRGYIVGAPLYDTSGSQYTFVELKKIASELGVEVGFTGFVDSARAMRALDIVVHASTEPEPFGLVIAEAMACGRAVVTSGDGGAAELVTAGLDAVTHTPGDAQALARAIELLADDASLRQQFGERAHASAVRKFHPDRFSAALTSVYEQAATREPLSRKST